MLFQQRDHEAVEIRAQCRFSGTGFGHIHGDPDGDDPIGDKPPVLAHYTLLWLC
jgi:hypothetical protein